MNNLKTRLNEIFIKIVKDNPNTVVSDIPECVEILTTISTLDKYNLLEPQSRSITQEWFESDHSKTGWDTLGWYFADTNEPLPINWIVIEHTDTNKFGNPIKGIATLDIFQETIKKIL